MVQTTTISGSPREPLSISWVVCAQSSALKCLCKILHNFTGTVIHVLTEEFHFYRKIPVWR
jgi:hypothetical protein